MQLCYKFGELEYRPRIEEFANYFLWNKIQRDIISNNGLEKHPIKRIGWINRFKIEHKLSNNNFEEFLHIIWHQFYINVINANEDKKYEILFKKLSDVTRKVWSTHYLCYGNKFINWCDSDYLLICDNNNYFFEKKIIFFDTLENYESVTNSDSKILYCDEMYIKYSESVLRIVNEVMNTISEHSISSKQIEINSQLNELFRNKVFCYINRYLYISERREYIKIAIRIREYNILILSKNIEIYSQKKELGSK
jgi:hypothetical protein